jgi:hypothetical protein
MESDISHIAGCKNNIQHVVRRARCINTASAEQRCLRGARHQWVLQEEQVQELQSWSSPEMSIGSAATTSDLQP